MDTDNSTRLHRCSTSRSIRMTIRTLFLVFIVALTCSTGLAEGNWVQQFLARYKPVSTASSQTTPAVRPQSNGMSLTTEDLVRMILENNRDVLVNRLSPLSSRYVTT